MFGLLAQLRFPPHKHKNLLQTPEEEAERVFAVIVN
jgi:hypothetical protein